MTGWYGGEGWGMGAWIAMGFGMVVVWGLVILGVVALLRTSARNRLNDRSSPSVSHTPGSYSAIEQLDDRFARGEITEDEYVHMRDTLLGH